MSPLVLLHSSVLCYRAWFITYLTEGRPNKCWVILTQDLHKTYADLHREISICLINLLVFCQYLATSAKTYLSIVAMHCDNLRIGTELDDNYRPTYIDKYEEFQGHLHNLFLEYVEKHQNLQWLETQIESHSREEQEKMDGIHRRMRHLQRSIQNEVTLFDFKSHFSNMDNKKPFGVTCRNYNIHICQHKSLSVQSLQPKFQGEHFLT